MRSRRNFLTRLAGVCAAAAVAPALLPALTRKAAVAKPAARLGLVVPNPEWVKARYEIHFFGFEEIRGMRKTFGFLHDRRKINPVPAGARSVIAEQYPIRGDRFDSNGFLISIPPAIMI